MSAEEIARLHRQIADLDRMKPDPDADPDGYRRVTDEITRLCDRVNFYRREPYKRKVV